VRKDSRITARSLLDGRSMRSLPARLLALLLTASLTVAVLAILPGCGATPDTAAGGEGATTNGATVSIDGEQAPGDNGDDGTVDGPLVAADDGAVGSVKQGLTVNGKMRATANVNLRKGAGTSFAVLAVIPSGTIVTLLDATPKNGFLNVQFNGTSGWSSASYLTEVAATGGGSTGGGSTGGGSTGGGSTGGGTPSGGGSVDGPASPDNAIARAKAAVGFSYYWGGGAWTAGGATSSNKGSCSGSCPSCSHSGQYGADCSGLVAKAWQFGAKALETNSHPYSTASFVNDTSSWSTVSRSSLRKGDALVYNSGGAGHIVIYEKGDGWGTPTVIECRGCAYGCVYNARSFASNYHAIRRSGF
jgi:cell wall-associated NlpC family hydrolase